MGVDQRYFAIGGDLHYITFQDNENVLCCVVSLGYFCGLNTALHPVDKTKECSYFLFVAHHSSTLL